MELTGVSDVVSFDENEVIFLTSCGRLTLCGTSLHIERMSLESGEITVEGRIVSLDYEDGEGEPEKRGFFGKLFG